MVDHFLEAKRVREVATAVADPGEARTRQQLVAERLLPQPLDGRELGEEPVAAEVEAVAVPLDGARDPSDLDVRLEDGAAHATTREHVASGQPCRTGADHRIPH